MKHFFYILLLFSIFLHSCADDEVKQKPKKEVAAVIKKPETVKEYGFPISNYDIVRDTVRAGDSFGKILFDNGIDYAEIQQITDQHERSF